MPVSSNGITTSSVCKIHRQRLLDPCSFARIETSLLVIPKEISDETIKPVDECVEQWLSPSIQMKRELKPEEHEKIIRAIVAGDRVEATSIYLSATEGNLTEAQNFIKALTVEQQHCDRSSQQKSVADPQPPARNTANQ